MYITTHFVHRLFASSLLDDKTTLNVIFLKPVNSKKEYIQKIFKIKGPPFSTELEALFTKHDIFLLLSEFHNSNYTMKNTQSYAENE